MSCAVRCLVSPARPQEIDRSDGRGRARVVVLINLNAHRPAAVASPTGSDIMGTSSPRTTASARGCRSTSSTSCRRRRATARATLPAARAPTARAGCLGAAAPRVLRARRGAPSLCLYIYLTTYYYGTYSLRRRRRRWPCPAPHGRASSRGSFRVETRRKIGAALVERCWSQSIARVANESDS